MDRTPITIDLATFPEVFHEILKDTPIFDSSCSHTARVYFLDREDGFFLKSAPKGSLEQEKIMSEFFWKNRLGPEVLAFAQTDRDWMLTRRIPGEDCTNWQYLDDPKRLCDTLAEVLRMLHDTPISGYSLPDRTAALIRTAAENHRLGKWDDALFPDNWGYRSAEGAWSAVEQIAPLLKSDTLIHGDYCLPNILLKDWVFSGLLDLGAAGRGDRHMDLFWGCWSLGFNLKTDGYRDRFLDCYGRDRFEPEILNAIGAFEVFG